MSKRDLLAAYAVTRPQMALRSAIIVNGHRFFAVGDPSDGEFECKRLVIVTLEDGFRAETARFQGPVAGSPLAAVESLRLELQQALVDTSFVMVRGYES